MIPSAAPLLAQATASEGSTPGPGQVLLAIALLAAAAWLGARWVSRRHRTDRHPG